MLWQVMKSQLKHKSRRLKTKLATEARLREKLLAGRSKKL